MARYRDDSSTDGSGDEPVTPRTPFNERDLEQSLLDRSSDRSSEDQSNYGNVEEKDSRIKGYHDTAPRCSRQKILIFFVLVILILTVIFSQLFIETPPESTVQAAQQPTFDFPPPDASNWESPQRAPQDYVVSPDWDFDAAPTRREFFWTIQDVVKHPDGVYRPMMVINGQFPGPMVEVNEGDTIVAHVRNLAQNATSIHWHGLFQNGTNWMDGTVGVTQCPIAPGANFTYEFTVDNQYGTYWYHAHHGVQAADGMVGPLVVHSKAELALQEKPYASDRVVMVSDHYYETSHSLLMDYLASNKENAEPTPDTALINGRGVQDCGLYPERPCDSSNVHYPQFNMEPGQSHRLRLINAGAFAEFQISVDEHPFTVTEVDGTTVKAAEYDRLNINPAQRYSIVIDTASETSDAFWLRAKMLTTCFQDPDPRMNAEAKAIIKYGAPDMMLADELPQSQDLVQGPDLECRDMNITDLVALPEMAAPAHADATFYLRSNFEIGAWQLSRGMFNGSSWRPDVQRPVLHRMLDGLHAADPAFYNTTGAAFVNDDAFDTSRELVIQTEGLQTIDLLVSNFDDGNHPLHLHGYKFFVLAQGHGYPPADLYKHLDLTNPMRRDTASVEAYGWTMLRVTADNPGAWAFHCHVAWHSEAGLAMQLVTRTDRMAEMALPTQNSELCAAPVEQLKLGGTPDDEVFMHEKEAET